MRRQDGQARALFRLLTMPILAALKHADVIPIDGQEGGTQEAQFCKDLLFASAPMGGMTHSITKTIKQMLLALFNGFSAWELVYWVPKTGPNKGKITLRKIDWRPSETLTFLLDGQGEFNGFRLIYDSEPSSREGPSMSRSPRRPASTSPTTRPSARSTACPCSRRRFITTTRSAYQEV